MRAWPIGCLLNVELISELQLCAILKLNHIHKYLHIYTIHIHTNLVRYELCVSIFFSCFCMD